MKILVIAPYYRPAFKAGGPVKSISNLIAVLKNSFSIFVVTRDRDLNDHHSFDNIIINKWLNYDKVIIKYFSEHSVSLCSWFFNIRKIQPDIIYINSLFDYKYSIQLVILNYLGLFNNCKLIIAPRGELYPGSLNIKSYKKIIYLELSKCLGLYNKISWHSTSNEEAYQIYRILGVEKNNIITIPNVADLFHCSRITRIRNSDNLRIVFISRISPKKNLKYVIQVLSEVKRNVKLDIYGPIEDEYYWQEVQTLIQQLPINVKAFFKGFVKPNEVIDTIAQYDLFFFPTFGENYGHVIVEAFLANTRVLISDQTPWRDLENDGLGWDIPLSDFDRFVSVIEKYDTSPFELSSQKRNSVYDAFLSRVDISSIKKKYIEMFNN